MQLILAKSKSSISFMMILALILNVGYFLDGKVYGSTGTDIRIHTNINNLQAIQFKDQVYLKWTGINHAKGYNVYRSNVSGQFEYPVTDFLTTTNNFYLDKNFGTAHNLYYIVKPVFDNSSEGSSSNEARVEEIKVSKVVLQIDNPVMIINDVFSINIDPAAPAVSPRLENGRTMLPIRSLVETLGGSVSWKPETRQIVINIEDKDIVFTLDQVAYTLNGQNKMFDVAPQIFENRTFVPVRAISQLLQGFTTNWKSDTRQVEILSSTHTINLDTLPPTLPTSPNPTETNILKKQFPLSISADKPVSLILENRSNELIEFYWIDYVGKPILYNRVLPGENAHQLSYATHSWVIADSNQNLITNFIASDIELQNYTLSPDKKLLSSLPPILTDAEKENIVIENMKALETILQPIQYKYPRMIGADWGNQDKFNDAIADAIFAAINRNPRKFKNPFNNLSAFEQGPADANASTKPVTVRLFNYGASNMQASYEFYDTQLNNGSYSRSKMEGTILVALYSDDQTTDPRQFRLTIMGFGKGGRTLSTPRNNIIHIPSTILPLNKVVVFNDEKLTDDDYIAYDTIYKMNDPKVRRATSQHFQLIWGETGPLSSEITTEFIRGNLENLESIRSFNLNELKVNDAGISVDPNFETTKRKTNLYITETGLSKHEEGWAFMAGDEIGMGYMILHPHAMRVSPPSSTLAHEYGHVVTMHLKGWNENEITGAWWESVAEWYADKYTLSDSYTQKTSNNLPESEYIEPFLKSMDLVSPHMENYYHYFALLHYLEENPDNLPGIGNGFVNDLQRKTNMGEYPFDAIQRLSGTSIKTIMGNYAKRIPTSEFFNPQNYTAKKYQDIMDLYKNRFNESLFHSSDEIITTLNKLSDNTFVVPENKAPMQGGINLIKLYPNDYYGLNEGLENELFVNFTSLISERRDADFRVNLVKIKNDGSVEYSKLWAAGTNSIQIDSTTQTVYMTVVSTPNSLVPTNAFEQSELALKRYFYQVELGFN
jgi:hypothetical protein